MLVWKGLLGPGVGWVRVLLGRVGHGGLPLGLMGLVEGGMGGWRGKVVGGRRGGGAEGIVGAGVEEPVGGGGGGVGRLCRGSSSALRYSCHVSDNRDLFVCESETRTGGSSSGADTAYGCWLVGRGGRGMSAGELGMWRERDGGEQPEHL